MEAPRTVPRRLGHVRRRQAPVAQQQGPVHRGARRTVGAHELAGVGRRLDAGLPVVALVRYAQVETDASKRSLAKQAIEAHLKYLLAVTSAVVNPFDKLYLIMKALGAPDEIFSRARSLLKLPGGDVA